MDQECMNVSIPNQFMVLKYGALFFLYQGWDLDATTLEQPAPYNNKGIPHQQFVNEFEMSTTSAGLLAVAKI